MKQYSIKALTTNTGRGNNYSGNDSDDYGDDMDDDYGNQDQDYSSNEEEDKDEESLDKDKEWIQEFVTDQFKPFISKIESELDMQRNKKIKGTTSKKQKEKKEMELNYKLTQAKKSLEKIEELKA